MTIIGITGHSNLENATVDLIRAALEDYLEAFAGAEFVGVTCLAVGADQAFADVVLELGGSLEIVVPSTDYFDKISDPAARKRCDTFLASAAAIHTMPYDTAGHEAYLAASKDLVDRCDHLVAVWDGSPNSGTGQAVSYARQLDRMTHVLWPSGSRRV